MLEEIERSLHNELSGGILRLGVIDILGSVSGAVQVQHVTADRRHLDCVEILAQYIVDGVIVRTDHRTDQYAIRSPRLNTPQEVICRHWRATGRSRPGVTTRSHHAAGLSGGSGGGGPVGECRSRAQPVRTVPLVFRREGFIRSGSAAAIVLGNCVSISPLYVTNTLRVAQGGTKAMMSQLGYRQLEISWTDKYGVVW